jgi:hypothetical protein
MIGGMVWKQIKQWPKYDNTICNMHLFDSLQNWEGSRVTFTHKQFVKFTEYN